jgi:hypothetical protein
MLPKLSSILSNRKADTLFYSDLFILITIEILKLTEKMSEDSLKFS